LKLWGYMNKQSREFKSAALGKVAQVRSGYSFSSRDFGEVGTPVIRISDIYEGRISAEGAVKTTLPISDSDFILNRKDFAIAMSGATTGKIGIYYGSKAFVNQRVGKFIVTDSATIDKEYLYHFVSSLYFSNQLSEVLEQGAQPNISSRLLETFKISFPLDLNEQETIAKALSDIDELIAVTAQLLNKKERIFEGALKTEFSESSGAVLTMVKDICEVIKGSAVKYDKDFAQGSFGFLNGGINFSGSTEFANDSGDTVVISEGGNSCGFVNYIPKAFWCGGHAYRLLGFEGEQKYLYYALKKSEKEIMNLRVGSGLPNVQKKNLSDFKTPIHQSSKKQEEVVIFLDSLTAEISNLKIELAKYECIKQGMAHDLLTGKVRLV
jgi:type I restriction enzyme S subunit